MARKPQKQVLVVAAHPDDEVLGCGGTIARLSAECAVHIVILGEGLTSRSPTRGQTSHRRLKQLHDQAGQVARMLGARSIHVGLLPDNRFDELPLLDVVKPVERWIHSLKPEAVYTHHPGDLNIDHQITARAVLTATRPVPGCPVKELYAFEIPSSTEWAFQRVEPPFRPSVFMDIASTIDTKITAMQRYDGEIRTFPHPRSAQALRAIAQRWGSVAGMAYAEAFELIRRLE